MFNDHAFNSMTCPTRLNIPSTCIDGSTEIKDIVKEQYDSNDDMTNCFSGVNLMENCSIKFLQNRSQSPYLPDVTSRNKTNMVKARVLVTNSSLSDQALYPIRNREVEDDDLFTGAGNRQVREFNKLPWTQLVLLSPLLFPKIQPTIRKLITWENLFLLLVSQI